MSDNCTLYTYPYIWVLWERIRHFYLENSHNFLHFFILIRNFLINIPEKFSRICWKKFSGIFRNQVSKNCSPKFSKIGDQFYRTLREFPGNQEPVLEKLSKVSYQYIGDIVEIPLFVFWDRKLQLKISHFRAKHILDSLPDKGLKETLMNQIFKSINLGSIEITSTSPAGVTIKQIFNLKKLIVCRTEHCANCFR